MSFVSRVLFHRAVTRRRGGNHSSRMAVTDHLQQPTRRLGRVTLFRFFGGNACLRGLAPNGVFHAAFVTESAVGSYPAFSPLPSGIAPPGSRE